MISNADRFAIGETFISEPFYSQIFLRLPKIRLNYPKYVMAFVPPFEWIVQGVLVNDESMQQVLFERFRGRQNKLVKTKMWH